MMVVVIGWLMILGDLWNEVIMRSKVENGRKGSIKVIR